MPKKPSKHEQNLRALGCMPGDEILSKNDFEKIEANMSSFGLEPSTKMSRREIKRLVAQKHLPALLTSEGALYIIDEMGAYWSGPIEARPALIKLGFCDLEEKMKSIRKTSLH